MSGRSACDGVRTRLLEGAELVEIRRTERAHLEGCAACRAALGRVETRMAALADAIDAVQPVLSADEAVALAPGAAAGAGRRRDGSPAGGRRSTPRQLARAAGPAVALAAAILGIVWAGPWGPGDGVRPPPEALVAGDGSAGDRSPAADPADGLSVEAPATGGMAVFATRNPDIHVVWFYEDREPDSEDR